MSRYDSCSSCRGKGSFPCTKCRCSDCNASGKIACNKCTRGKIPCSYCESSGQIKKKWLFFTSTELCPECEGKKFFLCTTCNGTRQVKCQKCLGTGYLKNCPNCGDKRTIKCTKCGGTGRIESEWYKYLLNMSVERLRFEYEQRKHTLQQLEMQMKRLSSEHNQAFDVYMSRPIGWGSYRLDEIEKEINGHKSHISHLLDEMGTIEDAIRSKLK